MLNFSKYLTAKSCGSEKDPNSPKQLHHKICCFQIVFLEMLNAAKTKSNQYTKEHGKRGVGDPWKTVETSLNLYSFYRTCVYVLP